MTTTIQRHAAIHVGDRIHTILRGQARNRTLTGFSKIFALCACLGALLNLALLIDTTGRAQHSYTALALIAATIFFVYLTRRLEAKAARLRLQLTMTARQVSRIRAY